jgi:hypothetical protein
MIARRFVFACTVLMVAFASVGCAQIERGASVRRQLIDYLTPIQRSPFVEIMGHLQSAAGRESFLLLFGPRPKYVCRFGPNLFFNDGHREGRLDLSVFPPEEVTKDVEPDEKNMSYAIAMYGGPAVLALIREADGEEWLGMIEPPPPATVRYERVRLGDDSTRFLIDYTGGAYEFTFSEPARFLRSVVFREADNGRERAAQIVITRLTFPDSVSDRSFQMEAR